MKVTDTIRTVLSSVLIVYVNFLRLAGILCLSLAVVHLVLPLLDLFVGKHFLSRGPLPSFYEIGYGIILYLVAGPLSFYIESTLIHPSRFGPVLTYLQRTPDSKVYSNSLVAFVIVHMFKPFAALIMIAISLTILYPGVFDFPLLA